MDFGFPHSIRKYGRFIELVRYYKSLKEFECETLPRPLQASYSLRGQYKVVLFESALHVLI